MRDLFYFQIRSKFIPICNHISPSKMSKSPSTPSNFLNEGMVSTLYKRGFLFIAYNVFFAAVSEAVESHLSDGIQILKQDLIKVRMCEQFT